MTVADLEAVACPVCRGTLEFHGGTRGDELWNGCLTCSSCGRSYGIQFGLPQLYDPAQTGLRDRLMRFVYDAIAPFHDAGARFALPILQLSSSTAGRDAYMRRVDLGSLDGNRPVRVLEVGVGAGANLPLIDRDLPFDVEAEVWGVDLSPVMLAQCRLRTWWEQLDVRLMRADAHHLPFPDASFDRVFHTGGIATYSNPQQALAEMARVARPETPIMVVDEQLAPSAANNPYFVLTFTGLTWYDGNPHAPVEHLPAGAYDVRVEQVSRFYYCLTFRMPAARKPAPAAIPLPARRMAATGDRSMEVKDILTATELAMLERAYDWPTLEKKLNNALPSAYALTGDYVNAIGAAFYGYLPPDDAPPPRSALSLRDRERCLIAILASRGADFNIALHMYIALMNDISAEEIAHILFLAGIYTGVDNFAEALKAEVKMLYMLKSLVASTKYTVDDVWTALQKTFP